MKDLTREPVRSLTQTDRQYTANVEVKSNLLKQAVRPLALLSFGLLGGLEKIIWPEAKLRYSPIFIVAPPRSGTTLLYQLMTEHLATCYFSNLAQRLRVHDSEIIPILAAHLVKWFGLGSGKAGSSSFESYYGATEGWGGPNEANGIFERWFPEEEHYVPPGYLSSADRNGVYRAVAGTERVFDRPFVNKCIRNSVRIEALAEIFPTALFIQCLRDPLAMAQSIYIARTQDLPFKPDEVDPLQWWFSVKPKEYEQIKCKSMVAQVCEQVYYVEQNILAARQTLGDNRFLLVDYKDLCRSPRRTMDNIVRFMNERNAPTQITKPLPISFPYSNKRKIERAEYQALGDYLSQLYNRPMEVNPE